MPRKLTHKEFSEKLYIDERNRKFELMSKYINSNTNMIIKHKICGYEFKRKPSKLLSRGTCCPKCDPYAKTGRSQVEFEKEVKNILGEEYIVITDYTNVMSKVKMKHKTCGHVYNVLANSILSHKTGCPKCARGGILWTQQEFDEIVDLLVGNEYTFVQRYVNYDTKILVRHNKCGNEYHVSPNKFIYGRRCPICSQLLKSEKRKKSPEQFKKEFYNLADGDYELLSEYRRSNKKVKVRHLECGTIYEVNPNNFLNGCRCPKCKSSNGEKEILNILRDNKIFFLREMTLDGLKYKSSLRMDFYIKLGKNQFFIEYDGKQHFEPQKFSSRVTEKEAILIYKQQLEKDKIKNQFCKQKNITLYRIPYTEYDNLQVIVRDILEKERSTTIPKGSTLQATGGGNGESVTYTMI